MNCALTGKRIRRGQRFYKIYFSFQSVGHKPRRRSPSAFVPVSWDSVEKLMQGKKPNSRLGAEFRRQVAELCKKSCQRDVNEPSREGAAVFGG